MTQTELPLYPKISTIYNKILQLAIAIIIIGILLHSTIDRVIKDEKQVETYFTQYGHDYLSQAASATTMLIQDATKEHLKQHIENLSSVPFVNSVFLYDKNGQEIFSAGELKTIKTLYGIDTHQEPSYQKYTPFVAELRGDKLHGYLRLTIEQPVIVQRLEQDNAEHQEQVRYLLFMAGVAGFFLTRGLSRFNRKGFRVANQ